MSRNAMMEMRIAMVMLHLSPGLLLLNLYALFFKPGDSICVPFCKYDA